MKWVRLLGEWAVVSFLAAGCASSQPHRAVVVTPDGAIMVPHPSPPVLHSNSEFPSEAGYVWTSGYWSYAQDHWVWLSGHWQAPPPANAKWVPGHWEQNPRGWVLSPGNWE